VISTIDGLENLRGDWSALFSKCPNATPFQSPAWLIPWARHIRAGELWVHAFTNSSNQLVGLAPLYIFTDPTTSQRRVFPLGVSTSDYLDVLIAPGWEHACTQAFLAILDDQEYRWDSVEFTQIPARSPLLAATLPTEWLTQTAESEPCATLDLPPTLDELSDRLPRNMLQNLTYYRRRADRAGELAFELADDHTMSEVTEALFTLHQSRWSLKGKPGVLADAAVQLAHRESIRELHRQGFLRLHALRLDRRIIAVTYALADPPRANKRIYYYLGGFDPAYQPLSPGTLLIHHCIQDAVREGATHYDFLRGSEPYKLRWGAHFEPTFQVRFTHATTPAPCTPDLPQVVTRAGTSPVTTQGVPA
jgi:CelD/BcsL family acetyltransferase involved in cellulose biosynthesis